MVLLNFFACLPKNLVSAIAKYVVSTVFIVKCVIISGFYFVIVDIIFAVRFLSFLG